MTNEQHIENLKKLKSFHNGSYGADIDKAIKALEQESCDDAISRQALLDAFGFSEKTRKWGGDHSGYDTMMLYEIQDVIESQPPVNPQEPKTIQEKQAESEKYQKAFDDGYANGYTQARFDYEQDTKTGHWIKSNIPNEEYVCSECGGGCWYYDYQANVAKSRYCPNCGAKMVEPQESDKCSKCKYHINPDYTRCKECGAERSDKE